MARLQRIAAAHAALLLLAPMTVRADIDCRSNITIADGRGARAVAESCTVIEGNLQLRNDVSETINLDGIEVIKGSITHSGCDERDFEDPEECVYPQAFNLTSNTLREINGDIDFYYFQGLDRIEFPELEIVNKTVSLQRLHNVTHIDFTSLKWVGYFSLETRKLETLLLEGLEGFLDRGWGHGGVQLQDAGQVESVDGFFKNAIDPIHQEREETSPGTSMHIYNQAIPNVRSVTFGWTRCPEVGFGGENLTVTLGGADTKEQQIGELKLGLGVVELRRGSAVENLTVGSLEMQSQEGMVDLALPFDQISKIRLSNVTMLETVEFPEEAENWKLSNFDIYNCPSLSVADSTWHWPKEHTMSELNLVNFNLTNGFT
jgi:hypothetical protein